MDKVKKRQVSLQELNVLVSALETGVKKLMFSGDSRPIETIDMDARFFDSLNEDLFSNTSPEEKGMFNHNTRLLHEVSIHDSGSVATLLAQEACSSSTDFSTSKRGIFLIEAVLTDCSGELLAHIAIEVKRGLLDVDDAGDVPRITIMGDFDDESKDLIKTAGIEAGRQCSIAQLQRAVSFKSAGTETELAETQVLSTSTDSDSQQAAPQLVMRPFTVSYASSGKLYDLRRIEGAHSSYLELSVMMTRAQAKADQVWPEFERGISVVSDANERLPARPKPKPVIQKQSASTDLIRLLARRM